MKIKGLIDEDFVNYKKPSMYIIFPTCSFKCDKENKRSLCHNSKLVGEPDIEISKDELIKRYLQNPITEAIVCGGLEPFDSPLDLLPFIDTLRRQYKCNDPIVIYTGYTEEELESGNWGLTKDPKIYSSYWSNLKKYNNIIVKFGRFRPDCPPHYDHVLGVNLISPNQYAKEINNG